MVNERAAVVAGPDDAAGSKTLNRGLRILESVADRPGSFSTTTLAREVGLHRTVCYRLLATLAAHGLVDTDAEGRLHPGLGLIDLAAAETVGLRRAAKDVLRELAAATGATAHLTVIDRDEALSIAVEEPLDARMHVAYRVGYRHALDRGAAGLAILSGRAPASGERHEVGLARVAGYAVSRNEIEVGAWGMAAPVGRPGDPANASIGVVALAPLDEAATSGLLLAAARAVGRHLP